MRMNPTATRQEGSVIVAILVLTVVFLVTLAFVIRTAGDLTTTGHVADLNTARAAAEAGLSDALFRIDQEGTNTSSFCVGPSSACTVQSVPSAPNVQYVAQRSEDDPDVFTVTSMGTVKGRSYAIQAMVQRVPAFPFAIFAGTSVTFDGASSSSSIQAVTQTGQADGSAADVGSTGTITCNGTGPYGTQQVTFNGGTFKCPDWVQEPAGYSPQQPSATCPPPQISNPPTPCMPSSYQTCPTNNTFTGTVEPGVYYCQGSATFSGTVNVDYGSSVNNGQVQIYLFPPSGSSTVSIEMAGAAVNQYQNAAANPPLLGNPVDFQVYAAGSGTVDVGNGSNTALFDGILYAPGMNMTVNGGSLLWYGSFTLNQFSVHGNPNLNVNYMDQQMNTLLVKNWQVENFTQVPVSSFSLSFTTP